MRRGSYQCVTLRATRGFRGQTWRCHYLQLPIDTASNQWKAIHNEKFLLVIVYIDRFYLNQEPYMYNYREDLGLLLHIHGTLEIIFFKYLTLYCTLILVIWGSLALTSFGGKGTSQHSLVCGNYSGRGVLINVLEPAGKPLLDLACLSNV